MKLLPAVMALLLVAPGTAQAASRCGRASAPAGAGTLEVGLWQDDGGTSSEHAELTIPARGDRFVMVLSYRPAGGQVSSPYWVHVYAYATGPRQVRRGDVLGISAGGARWQGTPWITGLFSRSGRPGPRPTIWSPATRHRRTRR